MENQREKELLLELKLIRDKREEEERTGKMQSREDAYNRCLNQTYIKEVLTNDKNFPDYVVYRKISNVRKKDEGKGEFSVICDVHELVRLVSRQREEDFLCEGTTYESGSDMSIFTTPQTRSGNYIHDNEEVITQEEFEKAKSFAIKIVNLHIEFFNK